MGPPYLVCLNLNDFWCLCPIIGLRAAKYDPQRDKKAVPHVWTLIVRAWETVLMP